MLLIIFTAKAMAPKMTFINEHTLCTVQVSFQLLSIYYQFLPFVNLLFSFSVSLQINIYVHLFCLCALTAEKCGEEASKNPFILHKRKTLTIL